MDENVEAALVTELAQRLSIAELEGRYLPRHIVHDILAQLPQKSLVRFQSVCRNWRYMISDLDNNFAMDENVVAALVTELAQRLSVTEMEGQYLPRDIVLNILARLPLKSLVRFQSVCENWRGMIYDLDAILVQQSMSKVTITYGSADGRRLFFKLKNNNRQVCSLSLKTEYIWAEKACSNKFVLFSADDNGRRLLSVYNAVTDQFRLVPEIPSIFHTTRYVYSLVYDASAETCKVILFHCEDFIQHCCIYSFNDDDQWGSGSSGDWRTLQLPCSQKIMKSPNSAIDVNGILYWVAKPNFEDYGGFIQPMDIAAEKFKTFIEVPCQPWKKNCHLLKIKESLCFMNTACVDKLHIWMLKNSDSLWILNHKISLSSMVGRPTSLSTFLHDNFNPWLVVEGIGTTYIMVTLDGIYVPYWYNIETKELRHISMAGKDLAPFCEPFMPRRRFELTFNISEVFCLRTISFIDDLRPDFQSKFSGFIIAEKRGKESESKSTNSSEARLSWGNHQSLKLPLPLHLPLGEHHQTLKLPLLLHLPLGEHHQSPKLPLLLHLPPAAMSPGPCVGKLPGPCAGKPNVLNCSSR